MSNKLTYCFASGILALGLGAVLAYGGAPPTPQGVITGKGWLNDGSGTAITDLTGSTNFPNNPTFVYYLPYFEWNPAGTNFAGDINTPADNGFGDSYGDQMIGYFYPPTTADYVFFIASDDLSDLYLSTDDTAANKKLIAQETAWSNSREYQSSGGNSNLASKDSQTFAGTEWPTKDPAGGAKITLTAGKAYYIETLHKEGGGGDNCSVAVNSLDGTINNSLPLSGRYLSSFDKNSGPASITTQPLSVTVNEGQPATFSVVADGTPPLTYAWSKAGVAMPNPTFSGYPKLGAPPYTNIFTSVTIPRVYRADNGAKVHVVVQGAQGSAVTSADATITVVNDTTPPTLTNATPSADRITITLTFSEPLDPTSATATANYQIDNGVSVIGANLGAPPGTTGDNIVTLTTSKQPQNTTLTITVNNVKDVPGNVIAAGTKITVQSYALALGWCNYERWDGDTKVLADFETAFNNGTEGTPDVTSVMNQFDGPWNIADTYNSRTYGWFIAPSTASYVFFLTSDDQSDLFLSSDDTRANEKLIASETQWSNQYQWTASGGNSDLTAKRSDTFSATAWPTIDPNTGGAKITLSQGNAYYIEIMHHEGTGGDGAGATFIKAGDPDPANSVAGMFLLGNVIATYLNPAGASVTITTQPVNTTGIEGFPVTFTALATATSPYVSSAAYDWQSAPAGSSTFTDIAGGTSASLTIPGAAVQTAASGTQYRVICSVPTLAVTSSVVTLTVVADTTPPVVVGASALKNQAGTYDIGVVWNKQLNWTSATNTSNYTLSPGTIKAINFATNSPAVIVTATNLSAGATATLTIQNVQDYKGNKLGSTNVSFTVTAMSWGEVGNNVLYTDPTDYAGPPGYVGGFPNGYAVVAVATNGFDLYSDGWAEWNNYDETTFVYEPVTGDFDKMLEVVYQDNSSEWARAGIAMREDLSVIGMNHTLQEGSSGNSNTPTGPPYDGLAGRYQKVHVNPVGLTLTDANGNNAYEGNRRLAVGSGSSSALTANGTTPLYPTAWCRIQRFGNDFNIFRSDDSVTWVWMGRTTWSADVNAPAMPSTVYVGPEYSPELGNFASDEQNLRGRYVAKMRNYGNTWGPAPVVAARKYSIGVNFGSQYGPTLGTPVTTALAATDVAGIPGLKQANWNNDTGTSGSGSVANLMADKNGTAVPTTCTVTYAAPNYWSTQGNGETNNCWTGPDMVLMNGYLDTGSPTTTTVTFQNIPTDLTSGGYDVYVYATGGTGARGGGYEVLDAASGTVLKPWVYKMDSWYAPNYYPVPDGTTITNYGVGNYVVFRGLTSAGITIQASTDFGLGTYARGMSTPRAPMNAIQLVSPSTGSATGPTVSIARSGTTIKITFTGNLYSAATLKGPWAVVTGATSPYTVSTPGFYRAGP